MKNLIRWIKKILIASILLCIGFILLFVTMGAIGNFMDLQKAFKKRNNLPYG